MGRSRKFTLLWLVSLAAIAVVIYGRFVNLNRVIQPSLRQLEGLARIEPLSRTVQRMQLHRGLSAALRARHEAQTDVP
jgi:type II secretory pathway component PulJ